MIHRRSYWVAAVALLLVGSLWAADRSRQVQVRETTLRDKPSALGKVLGTLRYGEQVQVGEDGDAWSRVSSQGQDGWVRSSALTTRKIQLLAGDGSANIAASSEEIALAGKGMAQAEKLYREQNANLAEPFTFIDQMEKQPLYRVSPDELRAFLESGGLTPREDLR
jgi:uncharacterized protein YgiM (DUF1202 family)